MHVGRLLAARTGGAAPRVFESSARALVRRRQWAAASTSATGEEVQPQQQDTLRATLRDLPGPVASALADELLLCGAFSASVDEFRAPGGAEQKIFGARGRDGRGEEEEGGGAVPCPSDDDGAAVFWDRCTLTAIFDKDADVPAALHQASLAAGVDAAGLLLLLPRVELSEARASEWLDALRGAFSPVFVEGRRKSEGGEEESGEGRGLWILPEGCSLPQQRGGEGGGGEASSASTTAADPSSPSSSVFPSLPPPVVVRLTPGLAFGTGDHPTTRMCLRWLATAEVTGALRARAGGAKGGGAAEELGASLLDFGTGSGVLAAAAIALGCGSAVGTDVDPLALTAAAENAALNSPPPTPAAPSSSSSSSSGGSGGEETSAAAAAAAAAGPAPRRLLRTVLVPADPRPLGARLAPGELADDPVGPAGSFDVVVANILRGPLVRLAPALGRWAAPGAPVAVSGVLASQAADVVSAFESAGVELAESDRERCGGGGEGEEGWWVCLSGRKRL